MRIRLPSFSKLERGIQHGSLGIGVALLIIFGIVWLYSLFLPKSTTITEQVVLNYSGKVGDTFPLEVLERANVRELNLSNNALSRLPDDISRLNSLEVLDISNNDFVEFPSQIKELPALQTLNIANNEFIMSTQDVADIKTLKVLIVSRDMMPLAEQTKLQSLRKDIEIIISSDNLSQ